jgi:hypothetical protein
MVSRRRDAFEPTTEDAAGSVVAVMSEALLVAAVPVGLFCS